MLDLLASGLWASSFQGSERHVSDAQELFSIWYLLKHPKQRETRIYGKKQENY